MTMESTRKTAIALPMSIKNMFIYVERGENRQINDLE